MHKPAPAIFRMHGALSPVTGLTLSLFGKTFALPGNGQAARVLWHADYPLVTAEDVRAFAAFVAGKQEPAVSAKPARPHPYRLMTVDAHGEQRFVLPVSQDIRGARALYPEVFAFVPALVYLPAGCGPALMDDPSQAQAYLMDPLKLLDRARPLELLMLERLGKRSESSPKPPNEACSL